MSDTWAWISGWGIQPERFQAAVEAVLPEARHQVFAPEPGAVHAALESGATQFGGYSLGSLLLLSELPEIPQSSTVLCLAPILSFCQESALGGKTPLASLQALQAKLAKNPQAALKLFYRLAHLPEEPIDTLPYSRESLVWGLEVLAKEQVTSTNLAHVQVILGQQDSLLDSEILASYFEQNTVVQSPHNYRTLLEQYRAQATQ